MSPSAHPAPGGAMAGGLTVAMARALGREVLARCSTAPGLDTDLLLEHVSGIDRTCQITAPGALLELAASEALRAALYRRAAGEPVAYITGRKAFRTLELAVDRRVLVPRPETELLVEVALAALDLLGGDVRVIDVGTGSGAVALALAAELPVTARDRVEIVACDISQPALAVASANRNALGFERRIELVESDLLASVDGMFDVMLANLPYLRIVQRDPSTASEPDLALYAGDDGLDTYRRFLPQAAGRLVDRGLLACEIDPSQSAAMKPLAGRHLTREVAVLADLSGRERIVVAGAVDIVRTVVETWPYGA